MKLFNRSEKELKFMIDEALDGKKFDDTHADVKCFFAKMERKFTKRTIKSMLFILLTIEDREKARTYLKSKLVAHTGDAIRYREKHFPEKNIGKYALKEFRDINAGKKKLWCPFADIVLANFDEWREKGRYKSIRQKLFVYFFAEKDDTSL